MISRQPIRSGYETSSNAIGVDAASGAASGATNEHSRRIVESPPSPAGKLIAADVGSSVAAVPPTESRRSADWRAQNGAWAAAASASLTVPSPSVSMCWRSWNVGISAMSITTSRRISFGATVMPAKWLIVKLPSGCAAAAAGIATQIATAAIAAATAGRGRRPMATRVRGRARNG